MIDTEAIRLIASQEARSLSRDPEIMAEAALLMLSQPSAEYTCVAPFVVGAELAH
jgi:hypothetical protein